MPRRRPWPKTCGGSWPPSRSTPGRPAAWERAVKWVRRHPAVAALAGTGALAALTLAVVIGMANVRLKHERDLAEARRLEAVANLRKAREAVDRMLTRVSEERLKDIPQVEPVQRALLEDALEFYRDFARQAHDDPRDPARGGQGVSAAWSNPHSLRAEARSRTLLARGGRDSGETRGRFPLDRRSSP